MELLVKRSGIIALLILPFISAFAPVQNHRCASLYYSYGYATQQQQQQQQYKMSMDDNLSEQDERSEALDKALKAMTNFSNKYCENTGTKYCSDKSVPAVVIKGLAEHKVSLGAPLCPCRYYDDKEKEAKDGYWNCPCVPMRERRECHCMLFLTDDNAFVGEETHITEEEVKELTQTSLLG